MIMCNETIFMIDKKYIWGKEKQSMKNKNAGFTLGELLIVVVIIGVLVAISIPVFTAQRKKAIIAANKANIRAARAAAAAYLYGSDENIDSYEMQEKEKYIFCIYDINTGKVEKVLSKTEGYKDSNYPEDGWHNGNFWGKKYRWEAKEGMARKIIVYIGNPAVDIKNNGKLSSPIQTAPYYEGNEVGGEDDWNKNPFGPAHGSATAN